MNISSLLFGISRCHTPCLVNATISMITSQIVIGTIGFIAGSHAYNIRKKATTFEFARQSQIEEGDEFRAISPTTLVACAMQRLQESRSEQVNY